MMIQALRIRSTYKKLLVAIGVILLIETVCFSRPFRKFSMDLNDLAQNKLHVVPATFDSSIMNKAWIPRSLLEAVNLSLSSLPHKNIILLFSSGGRYTDLMFNWFCYASKILKPPWNEYFVLTTDIKTQTFLDSISVRNLYVNLDSVFSNHNIQPKDQIWMLRLLVIKNLVDLKYNVLLYDVDSLPLKDPSILFDRIATMFRLGVDIVAAYDRYPLDLGFFTWKQTIGMGMVLFNGTNGSSLLMEAVLKLPDSLLDDQIRINKALEAVHPTWINIDVANTTMYYGSTDKEELKVVILAPFHVCRRDCTNKNIPNLNEVYAYHPCQPQDGLLKSEYFVNTGFWLLKNGSDEDRQSIRRSLIEWANAQCYTPKIGNYLFNSICFKLVIHGHMLANFSFLFNERNDALKIIFIVFCMFSLIVLVCFKVYSII